MLNMVFCRQAWRCMAAGDVEDREKKPSICVPGMLAPESQFVLEW